MLRLTFRTVRRIWDAAVEKKSKDGDPLPVAPNASPNVAKMLRGMQDCPPEFQEEKGTHLVLQLLDKLFDDHQIVIDKVWVNRNERKVYRPAPPKAKPDVPENF